MLVDDDPLVRMGLRFIIEGLPDVALVSEAQNGLEALEVIEAEKPDVVLIDIRMPEMDGLTATKEIVRRYGDRPRVLVLSTFDSDDLVLEAVRNGAAGFLVKDTPPEELIAALRTVIRGQPAVSPSVLRTLMTQAGDSRDASPSADERAIQAQKQLAVLNDREFDVAMAIGQGMSNADISRSLFMSVASVKAHVSRLLGKLDVANRVQVAILVHDAQGGRDDDAADRSGYPSPPR